MGDKFNKCSSLSFINGIRRDGRSFLSFCMFNIIGLVICRGEL